MPDIPAISPLTEAPIPPPSRAKRRWMWIPILGWFVSYWLTRLRYRNTLRKIGDCPLFALKKDPDHLVAGQTYWINAPTADATP